MNWLAISLADGAGTTLVAGMIAWFLQMGFHEGGHAWAAYPVLAFLAVGCYYLLPAEGGTRVARVVIYCRGSASGAAGPLACQPRSWYGTSAQSTGGGSP